MTTANEIGSVPEFYAHALAIEREAAARYQELANQMWIRHNNFVAYVFLRLAREESKQLEELEREIAGVELPQPISTEYRWQGIESPEVAPSDPVNDLMTPHHALEIALANERRAAGFLRTYRQIRL
jgi:rubrerythrin